jgi:hypothetical protein
LDHHAHFWVGVHRAQLTQQRCQLACRARHGTTESGQAGKAGQAGQTRWWQAHIGMTTTASAERTAWGWEWGSVGDAADQPLPLPASQPTHLTCCPASGSAAPQSLARSCRQLVGLGEHGGTLAHCQQGDEGRAALAGGGNFCHPAGRKPAAGAVMHSRGGCRTPRRPCHSPVADVFQRLCHRAPLVRRHDVAVRGLQQGTRGKS